MARICKKDKESSISSQNTMTFYIAAQLALVAYAVNILFALTTDPANIIFNIS